MSISDSVTSEGRRRRRRHRKIRRRGGSITGGGGGGEGGEGEGWVTSADEGWCTSTNESVGVEENWNAASENWDTQSATGRLSQDRPSGSDSLNRRGKGRGYSDGPPSREGTLPRRRPPRHEGTPARQSPGRRPPPQPKRATAPAVNGN